MKNLSWGYWYLNQELSSGPPEYKAGVLITQPQHSAAKRQGRRRKTEKRMKKEEGKGAEEHKTERSKK
jgi:hypothetical protein